MAVIQRLPVFHHYSSDYIVFPLGFFGITEFILDVLHNVVIRWNKNVGTLKTCIKLPWKGNNHKHNLSEAAITKTTYIILTPLKPHFHIVKLGYTGVYIFLYCDKKQILWVLIRTASSRRLSRDPTIYVFSKNMKNIIFLSESFPVLFVKCSIYLRLRVFVMEGRRCHYENTPIQIYRKFHLQKLKIFR